MAPLANLRAAGRKASCSVPVAACIQPGHTYSIIKTPITLYIGTCTCTMYVHINTNCTFNVTLPWVRFFLHQLINSPAYEWGEILVLVVCVCVCQLPL